ncbi:MAG: hypothetical protein IH840_08085, partial [Candidatus Heimdallarchaeota archaeon]|nr:hypothetical protein [Candidatus Heimdallarchaeota archaeon]
LYDFTQRFSADRSQFSSAPQQAARNSEMFTRTTFQQFDDGILAITITNHITTVVSNNLMGGTEGSSLQSIDFEQEGGLGAITPAIAVAVTPRLSAGVAVNFITDDLFGTRSPRSVTRSVYRGDSRFLGRSMI